MFVATGVGSKAVHGVEQSHEKMQQLRASSAERGRVGVATGFREAGDERIQRGSERRRRFARNGQVLHEASCSRMGLRLKNLENSKK